MLSIEIISAGAGSGKTYTLTERMVALLREGVRPSGIMATTFTQKAAAELQERVRVRLLELGMTDAANELGEALIGTVHSIGTRLLQRFAFEAGVSPLVEIIAAGDGQRLFNESLAQVLTEQRIDQMNTLAGRLGFYKKNMGKPKDWRNDIRQLTEVARANNFTRDVLEISKKRSWESFEALLPAALPGDAGLWNSRLATALEQAVAALEANESDETKTTRDATEVFRAALTQLRHQDGLAWYDWVKIGKTAPAVKSRDLVADLHSLVSGHGAQMAFREDVRRYIELVFDIAADALTEFEQYKKKRGLIDYTDMETYVSSLLRHEGVRAVLHKEIDLLLVDEFQDTSPIQLDIFLHLSRLARHSIWVGDPKQSIYGFRGAEPALMQAIIAASGGVRDENILKKSWRSRPDLVHATNHIFTKAFPDMPPEQVVLTPAFEEAATEWTATGSGVGRALIQWHFRLDTDERKVPGSPWTEDCIADQVSIFLEQKPHVFNKKRSDTRPVRAGDVAVLCRDNAACQRVADALHRNGLNVAIARTGLLETTEATLTLACLRFLLNPSDALSVAEVLVLTGQMDLGTMVRDRLDHLQAAQQAERMPRWGIADPFVQRLYELRPRTGDLSASEILDLLLDELDLRRLVVSLGDAELRLDNLEQLRKYALEYESACNRMHSAASLGGFLLWLDALGQAGGDDQGASEREDAVKVLTYHRSKGLEFPVVVCHSLDQGLKEQIWGVNLVSESDFPDLENILGNRWLRFWINPYADQLTNTALEMAVEATMAWTQAQRTALEEEARLMYVGLTRARDYLVFPCAARGTKWLNRVFSAGAEDIPTLDANSDETPFYHAGKPILSTVQLLFKPRDFGESAPVAQTHEYHAARQGRHPVPRTKYHIDTQKELPSGIAPTFGEPLPWGHWLEFKGEYSATLGKAVLRFLRADHPTLPADLRLERARQQLALHGLEELLSPAALVQQSDALQRFAQQQWDGLRPDVCRLVEGPLGQRWASTEPDWCVETAERWEVLVFGGFAEGMKKWKQQAQAAAPPLLWCKALLGTAKPVRLWVVFPMDGAAVSVQ